MKQFLRRRQRVELPDRALAVRGKIAKVFDYARLVEHGIADGLSKRRFVDQRTQLILIGQMQRRIVLVQPRHGEFQGTTGVEAGRSCVGMHQSLGLPRRFVERRPLGLQEAEVAHSECSGERTLLERCEERIVRVRRRPLFQPNALSLLNAIREDSLHLYRRHGDGKIPQKS